MAIFDSLKKKPFWKKNRFKTVFFSCRFYSSFSLWSGSHWAVHWTNVCWSELGRSCWSTLCKINRALCRASKIMIICVFVNAVWYEKCLPPQKSTKRIRSSSCFINNRLVCMAALHAAISSNRYKIRSRHFVFPIVSVVRPSTIRAGGVGRDMTT